MNNLTEPQKAYIAGFIDGEGSISIHCYRRAREGGHISYAPSFRVYNTNKAVLDKICNWTGLGFVCSQLLRHERASFAVNCKPQYMWQLPANPIRELLPAIIPYLQIKRRNAELVMDFLRDKRPRGRGANQTELDRCEKITIEIRALNHRGLKVEV